MLTPVQHRLAHRESLDVAELLDEPVVVRRCPDPVWVEFWSAGHLRTRWLPAGVVEAGNLGDELQAVATGRAITLTTDAARATSPARASPTSR
jgi:hypothetical protein